MTVIEGAKKIPTTCPICKSKKEIGIPESIINQASQLTTVSLPKGLVCDHHFQMFVDKNFQVRGYQKVDFEIELGRIDKSKNVNTKFINENKSDDELFEIVLLDGNFMEFRPKNCHGVKEKSLKLKKEPQRKERMTLKEIYEEFCEFIDEENEEFAEYILKDKRRVKLG